MGGVKLLVEGCGVELVHASTATYGSVGLLFKLSPVVHAGHCHFLLLLLLHLCSALGSCVLEVLSKSVAKVAPAIMQPLAHLGLLGGIHHGANAIHT